MTVSALDHINVWTADLEATRRFYVDVLGLREGDRPGFRSAGAWLYSGDAPLVHLVARDDALDGPTGAVNHVAFQAQGLADVVARLDDRAIAYTQRTVPGRGIIQVFLHDPNGVQIDQYQNGVVPFPHLQDGMINLLFLGRSDKRKGLKYLLLAYNKLKWDWPNPDKPG